MDREMEITRPVYEMLRRAASRTSMHMPGHKGMSPFGSMEEAYALDTTELPLTDDLYCPEGALEEAQRLYAEAAGAAETVFLHNGSTSGIHVMLQLYAREGDIVLLPRNAHLSAVNGCIAGGLRVRWIPVRQTDDGYCYVAEEDVLAALERHPEAKALLLTRPDYYGGCIPMERVVAAAHAQGMRVVVDEAHGAHLPWSGAVRSAGALGADAWTQSVHKTTPGFTASAVLHLKATEDRAKALRLLRREQTSSPSFLMMMSIDDARAWMQMHGREGIRRVTEKADWLRGTLPEAYWNPQLQWERQTGYGFDPTRLVIGSRAGGKALEAALRSRGIDAEMCDLHRVVLILTAMDEPGRLEVLREALATIRADGCELPPELPELRYPERRMEVREATMADCEAVAMDEASGRIAAQSAGLYPPGIPLVCPGEVINNEVISLLMQAKNRERFGLEGDKLLCVRDNV